MTASLVHTISHNSYIGLPNSSAHTHTQTHTFFLGAF